LALATLASTVCGSAFAAEPYQFVNSWGSYGTADGQFVGPGWVASGPGAGIYVADTDGRVQVFDRTGSFIRKWNVDGVRDLAANQPAGHVYVYDGTGQVAVFDAEGRFERHVALTLDDGTPVSGPIAADSVDSFAVVFTFPYEPGGRLQAYNSGGANWQGSPLQHWHAPYDGYLIDLAVDPTVAEVQAFDVAWNTHVDAFFQWTDFLREVPASGSGPIAMDASKHLFRINPAAHAVQLFDADGTPMGMFGADRLTKPSGITVDTVGNVYVSDEGTHRVVKFAPGTVVKPLSVDFGSQPVDTASAPRSVELSNLGATPLTLAAVSLAGGQPASFSTGNDTCSGATLASAQKCTVDVSFGPQRTGAKTTTLVFTDDGGATTQLVPLSGTGTSPVQLSPTSLAFGSRPDHSTSGAKTVTLTNVGGADLTISGTAVTGTDATSFLAGADTCTGKVLTTGQTCTVRVRFRPLGAGEKTAGLRISDSATDSPQTVALTGTGTPSPWVERSVQGLKFGAVRVGVTTPAKSVTLTNVGSAPMTISAIAKEGTNPDDFVGLTETCTALGSLGPGQSCSASVAFHPTATGTRAATLTMTDTAPRNPHHVALSGTGT